MKQLVIRRQMSARRGHWSAAERKQKITIASGEVELLIDAEAILEQLGRRALLSAGKKARGLSGLVEVRARKVEKREEA